MNKKTAVFIIIAVVSSASMFGQTPSNNFLLMPKGANFYIYRSGNKNFIVRQSKMVSMKLNKGILRLASAKRIVAAGDDPAGLAVAENMFSVIQGLKQNAMNKEDLRNYLRYAESVIGQDQSLLNRLQHLIMRSSSGILGPDDRAMNQTEIDQVLAQIDMNARFSTFNTKQVIPLLTAKNLGVDKVNVVTNLYGSMKLVENAQRKLRRLRTLAGVKSNILTFQIKGQYYHMVNVMASESRIRDMDMAKGITNLIQNNVLLKTQYGIFLKGK